MSWSVDQAATENRNMSVAVRLQTDVGRGQADARISSLLSIEKSKNRFVKWASNSQRDTYRHR